MFEDWSRHLGSLDVSAVEPSIVREWLAGAAGLRSALDAFEARAAVHLGEASVVRGATRCTQREADRAVARGELMAALPTVADALATGAISAAHVDTLAKAARQTTIDDVARSDLLAVARAKPADAMGRQVSDFIRANGCDDDLARRLERQRRNRRAVLLSREMGVLHGEFDDTTFAAIRAAVDAETNRLFRLDGGRDGGAERRTPEQRRADAVAGLLTGARAARGAEAPPAVRNQMLVVAQTDGTAEIPGVGPLPRSEVERLMCISDIYGLVFDSDGQPLRHGTKVQLADDNQWRALIARDGGCIACGAHPSRCEAHHVVWRIDTGPTDIENLVLLCVHHHHLVHKRGWRLITGADGRWMLVPP